VYQVCRTMTIWLTAAMLVVQAVMPVNALGCGCDHHRPTLEEPLSGASCCCSATSHSAVRAKPQGCPHCHSASSHSKPSAEREPACHCAEQVPVHSETAFVADSLKTAADIGVTASTAAYDLGPVLIPYRLQRRVGDAEIQISRFSQIVFGVWLT
jgi:hypothetical protein